MATSSTTGAPPPAGISLADSTIQLTHTLTQCRHSVLAISSCAGGKYLLAGDEHGDVYVWSVEKLTLRRRFRAHRGHILALTCASSSSPPGAETLAASDMNEEMLYSAGGDGVVRAWRLADIVADLDEPGEATRSRFVVHTYQDSGDVHSLAYSPNTSTLFIGCKNASLQWFSTDQRQIMSGSQMLRTWRAERDSKFFGEASYEHQPQDADADVLITTNEQTLPFSHNASIYDLLVISRATTGEASDVLVSASGDGRVKLWSLAANELPTLLHDIRVSDDDHLAVLRLYYHSSGLLFCGVQGGEVKVFDLETRQRIRTLRGHRDDVLCLAGTADDDVLVSASADGVLSCWNVVTFDCVDSVQAHVSPVLAMCRLGGGAGVARNIVSAGSDSAIHMWTLPRLATQRSPMFSHRQISASLVSLNLSYDSKLVNTLKSFVAIRSVSGDRKFAEQCRLAARFLKSLLTELGAECEIIPAGVEDRNPLVIAKFSASTLEQRTGETKTVLFYGHYDVQPASSSDKWNSPPFTLTGSDGFLYGRGVTDNKGPILATVFAASELQRRRQLPCNVCFVIEGEEESGSQGFFGAVELHRAFFGPRIDIILISNSYWIDDQTPCLTYGLRGVVHATVEIVSDAGGDLHSGVMGGAVYEPLLDMAKIVGHLVSNDRKVLIPGFDDAVTALSDEERANFEEVASYISEHGDAVQSLVRRWRLPTLTIHSINVSGPSSNTVIPRSAKAVISMRIVPDQDLNDVIIKFQRHLKQLFLELKSTNTLKITIGHRANWWLGNTKSDYYRLAEQCVEQVWHKKPLLIREGGSIPAIPWLESFFHADAVHIPMGQASDGAHLPNERLRLENLLNGQRVMEAFLEGVM